MTALGSLCTGYGGLDMAAAAVIPGLRTAWVADTSPAAAALLEHRMPGVPNLGDLTATDWTAVEPVDVLAAGFPCQPVSNAGKRRGQDDDRWIWPAIADAVRVVRPRLVLLENVAALAVRGLDGVIADLASLRYVGSWRCVRASDVGAPHRRERIFIAARPADTDRPGRQGAGFGEPARRPFTAGHSAADATRVAEREPADPSHAVTGGRAARPEPGGRGVRTAADSDRQRDDRTAAEHGTHGRPVAPTGTPADTARDGRHERRPEPAGIVGGSDAPVRSARADWGLYEPAIRRWADILGRPAPAPTEPGRNGPRLAPVFVEWLMGLPAGHVTDVPGLSRNAQLALLGNGVVPQQGAYAYADLLDLFGAAA